MADKERITDPSMGSNELGTETNEDRPTGGLSAGTDTQVHLTALGGKKNKQKKEINDDKQEENDENAEQDFFEVDETDE
jgi:hypothetical protein